MGKQWPPSVGRYVMSGWYQVGCCPGVGYRYLSPKRRAHIAYHVRIFAILIYSMKGMVRYSGVRARLGWRLLKPGSKGFIFQGRIDILVQRATKRKEETQKKYNSRTPNSACCPVCAALAMVWYGMVWYGMVWYGRCL